MKSKNKLDKKLINSIESMLNEDHDHSKIINDDEALWSQNNHKIPYYIYDYYKFFYLKQRIIHFFDNPIINNLCFFFTKWRIENDVTKYIEKNNSILQISISYGNLSKKLLNVANQKHANLDIIDAIPYQIFKLAKKLDHQPDAKNVNLWLQDASLPYYKEYDVIIIPFLLNECPDFIKKKIIENALSSMTPNGKVIFIDYDEPAVFNPLKIIIKSAIYFFKPFTTSLLERGINKFTNKDHLYNWKKFNYLGSTYQMVIVTKK